MELGKGQAQKRRDGQDAKACPDVTVKAKVWKGLFQAGSTARWRSSSG